MCFQTIEHTYVKNKIIILSNSLVKRPRIIQSYSDDLTLVIDTMLTFYLLLTIYVNYCILDIITNAKEIV